MKEIMSNYNYTKIIASIGPSIAKETVLAKIMHEIDMFRLSLSSGFDDINKRYVESIQKMDNSKTIMLDLKGPEIKVRNDHNVEFKKGDEINIKYTENFEDADKTLFVDYAHISEIPSGEIITIEGDISLKITKAGDNISAKITQGGSIKAGLGIRFSSYVPRINFLNKKDEKDILWAISNNIQLISPDLVRTADDITTIRNFCSANNSKEMRIISKISTLEAINNIESIIDSSDGISINDSLEGIDIKDPKKIQKQIIRLCNIKGRPIFVSTNLMKSAKDNSADPDQSKKIAEYIKDGVDAISLGEEVSAGENNIFVIETLYKMILENQKLIKLNFELRDISTNKQNEITEYLIYQAYKTAKELDIRVIICPSKTGYTASKLSTLKPGIPIISFTQTDETYRFLNSLWGVKGFKVASGFTHDNVKKIGKEIIRFMNKGDMSLDIKILILHASTGNIPMPNMINGMEIYRFKDL